MGDLTKQIYHRNEQNIFAERNQAMRYRDEIDKLLAVRPDYALPPNLYYQYGTKPLENENLRYGKTLRRTLTFDPINGNLKDTTKYATPFI